ncbi:hypothetical protein C8Q74DRAFT_1373467 [Fomes fomentarius]|nr:hypothetical protein C8Q74DRAFT_1373467 [Fomes fomentarius]
MTAAGASVCGRTTSKQFPDDDHSLQARLTPFYLRLKTNSSASAPQKNHGLAVLREGPDFQRALSAPRPQSSRGSSREWLRLPSKVRIGAYGTERKVYHVLHVIKMERLEPRHTLTGRAFVEGWVELTQAHYFNWCNGIQHKDISLDNLMYRHKPDNTLCAVLNVWDLSCVVTEEKETYSGFELTGTAVPLLAIDLLSEEALAGKIGHLYRHDLESFIWSSYRSSTRHVVGRS